MNTKKILIISILTTLLLAVIGFSYAYFSAIISGNESASNITVGAGSLKLTYTDGQVIKNENILAPWTATKIIIVKNDGTLPARYNLLWETLTNTLIGKEALTYTIINAGLGATLNKSQIPNSGTNIIILDNVLIESGVTHTYTITFNYELTSIDQSSDMERVFNGKLKIEEAII